MISTQNVNGFSQAITPVSRSITGMHRAPQASSILAPLAHDVLFGRRKERGFQRVEPHRPPGAARNAAEADQQINAFEQIQRQVIPTIVFTPFQRQSMRELALGNSVLVTAPTSSGKTMIAKFAIEKALNPTLNLSRPATPPGSGESRQVFYTTPRKALSNEKFLDFQKLYGKDNVGLMTGDITVNPEAPVVIMTTEVLRNIQYQEPERLKTVGTVVFDECHFINDNERGPVWEESLINMPKTVQQIHLSATVGNAQEYADWINAVSGPVAPKTVLVSSDKRPIPTRYRFYDPNTGTIHPVFEHDDPSYNPTKRFLRTFAKPTYIPLDVPLLVDDLSHAQNEIFPAIQVVYSKRKGSEYFQNLLDAPTLVNQKEAAAIQTHISQANASAPGVNNGTIRGFSKGIGLHHAGMSYNERAAIESAMDDGLIKYTIATETLGAGINKPIKSIVFTNYEKFDGERTRPLTPSEFHQFVGRAGRLGKDTEGFVVLVPPSFKNDNSPEHLGHWLVSTIRKPPEPLISKFKPTISMTLQLARRYSPEKSKEMLKQSFAVHQQQLRGRGAKQAAVKGFERTYDAAYRVSQQLGLITPQGNLTELGYDVALVPDQQVLAVSTLFPKFQKQLMKLSPAELAGFVSALMNEDGFLTEPPDEASETFKQIAGEFVPLYIGKKHRAHDLGVNSQTDINFTFMPHITKWMNSPNAEKVAIEVTQRYRESKRLDISTALNQPGSVAMQNHWFNTWRQVEGSHLYVGHFMNVARRTANLLSHLKVWQTLPEELRLKLAIAEAQIKQPPMSIDI